MLFLLKGGNCKPVLKCKLFSFLFFISYDVEAMPYQTYNTNLFSGIWEFSNNV